MYLAVHTHIMLPWMPKFVLISTISLSSSICLSMGPQHAHWRASPQALLSMDIIPDHGLVVVGSRDHNVTLWTLEGACVGILGEMQEH